MPPNVITAVNGTTKVFIGEMVEKARQVQDEWLAADPTADHTETRRGPLLPEHMREAWRRYHANAEGGSELRRAGRLLGIEGGVGFRVGGERLFK